VHANARRAQAQSSQAAGADHGLHKFRRLQAREERVLRVPQHKARRGDGLPHVLQVAHCTHLQRALHRQHHKASQARRVHLRLALLVLSRGTGAQHTGVSHEHVLSPCLTWTQACVLIRHEAGHAPSMMTASSVV